MLYFSATIIGSDSEVAVKTIIIFICYIFAIKSYSHLDSLFGLFYLFEALIIMCATLKN